MRNPSKNTIKRLMRRAYTSLHHGTVRWNPEDANDYFFFNRVGAALFRMSAGMQGKKWKKTRICNLEPRGYRKFDKP